MKGLNKGNKYGLKKGMRTGKEIGVIYNENSGKYLVRIKKQCGQLKTIAQFDNKEDAEECYRRASSVINNK